MKKLLVPMAILLISAFIITGCGTSTPSPAATPSNTTTSVAPTATPSPVATQTAAPSTPSIIPSSPASTITTGGLLRVVDSTTPGTPIGWPPETAGGSVITMQIAEEPLLKEEQNGQLDPRLATSYDVSTDPSDPSVTFQLRQGVTFTDGTVFNAQAAKWNLDQIKTGGMTAPATVYWKSIEVIDDNTIKVHMTQWQNRLVRSFADSVAYMVSPTAYQKNGIDWMRWHMVGTGPFVQTNFQLDTVTKAVKYPNYWLTGHPYVGEVDYIYVPDEMTREALFKSGGADIMVCTPQNAYHLQTAGYKILTQNLGPDSLIPDSANADSPWSNIKVREAAEYAIDKVAMSKAFGYGFTTAAYQTCSPDSIAYDPALDSQNRNYNVTKAKQLMADAGYPNGFKTTIYTQSGMPQDKIVAVQAFLGAIGIQCSLQFPEAAQMNKLLNGGPWDNALLYTPMNQFANMNTTYNNFYNPQSNWFQSVHKPNDMWKILQASLITPAQDPATLQKVTDWLVNDCTTIPLDYPAAMWAVTNKVQNSGLGLRGASTYWNPENVWLSK